MTANYLELDATPWQQLPTQELNKPLRLQNQADEINALRIMILHAISF